MYYTYISLYRTTEAIKNVPPPRIAVMSPANLNTLHTAMVVEL